MRCTRSMKTYISLSYVILLLFCGSMIAGCIDSPSGEVDHELPTVRYGGQHYPEEYVLAGDPGMWTKYGINVNHILFSSGIENTEALISGNVDINVGADTRTVALFNIMPDDVLIIGTVQRGNRYSTIVREDSDIESWDDLKGKTVATRLGTGAESILKKYYEQEGYSWDDFDYVNLKVEDMVSALKQGHIEAFTAWEPTPAIAEAQGVGRVMRTYGDVSPVPVSLVTTKAYAENHEDEIVRFLAAHLDKAELIQSNPERAAEIASQTAASRGVDISPDAFVRVFERIDFNVEIDQSDIDSIYETAEFLVAGGSIPKVPVFAYDTSYVEKAKELRERGSY